MTSRLYFSQLFEKKMKMKGREKLKKLLFKTKKTVQISSMPKNGATTFGIMTLSITAFSIMVRSKKGLMCDTQQNNVLPLC